MISNIFIQLTKLSYLFILELWNYVLTPQNKKPEYTFKCSAGLSLWEITPFQNNLTKKCKDVILLQLHNIYLINVNLYFLQPPLRFLKHITNIVLHVTITCIKQVNRGKIQRADKWWHECKVSLLGTYLKQVAISNKLCLFKN